MNKTASRMGMGYYFEGVLTAREILILWDMHGNDVRKDLINRINVYQDKVLRSMESGFTSSFALGYFRTLEKKNDPVLKRVIAPFTTSRRIQ